MIKHGTFILVAALAQSVSAATLYKVSTPELPRQVEVVNQQKYKDIPSYPEAGTSSKWWMCGHAAFSTAINVLRSSNADHVAQLDYFHKKLLAIPRYADKANNSHRESWGDDLQKVVNSRSDFSARKVTTRNRDDAKNKLQNELTNSAKQQLVVLTQNHGWGHFVVLHEIAKDLTVSGGGVAKFADPYTGSASSQMTYTALLDGMRDAGTKDRYSFWVISPK